MIPGAGRAAGAAIPAARAIVLRVIERSLVVTRVSADRMPSSSGDVASLAIDYAGNPELLDHLGADRRVVSHNLTPLPNGDFLLSLFLETRGHER